MSLDVERSNSIPDLEPVFLESAFSRVELLFDAGRVQYRLWFLRDAVWICFDPSPSEIVTGPFFELRANEVSVDAARDRRAG